MALPSTKTMPKTRVVMQRPEGWFLIYLPGNRVVTATDEMQARRIVEKEAPGSTPVFE